jgi:hypothetical protein
MGTILINVEVKYWCPHCESPVSHKFLWMGYKRMSIAFILNQTCKVCKNILQMERIVGSRSSKDNA